MEIRELEKARYPSGIQFNLITLKFNFDSYKKFRPKKIWKAGLIIMMIKDFSKHFNYQGKSFQCKYFNSTNLSSGKIKKTSNKSERRLPANNTG